MAYARFGSGDVYVFFSVGDFLDCCGCLLQDREFMEDSAAPFGFYLRPVGEHLPTTFHDTQGMVDHLALHRIAGHVVPDGLEAELWADDARNFPNRSAADPE